MGARQPWHGSGFSECLDLVTSDGDVALELTRLLLDLVNDVNGEAVRDAGSPA
jgi:hypothetical protein